MKFMNLSFRPVFGFGLPERLTYHVASVLSLNTPHKVPTLILRSGGLLLRGFELKWSDFTGRVSVTGWRRSVTRGTFYWIEGYIQEPSFSKGVWTDTQTLVILRVSQLTEDCDLFTELPFLCKFAYKALIH